MKKVLVILMFMCGMINNGHAQTTIVENVINEIKTELKAAPKGTVYGLTKTTKEYYLINTPVGEYRVDKNSDGSVSILGVKAKLVSKKKNLYTVETSLGKFIIDIKKCTVIKQ